MGTLYRKRIAIGVIALSVGVIFWMLKKPEETPQPVQPTESKTAEERMVRRERTPVKRVPLPLPNLPLEEIKITKRRTLWSHRILPVSGHRVGLG